MLNLGEWQIVIYFRLVLSSKYSKIITINREHSLCGWSPVLQVWTQLVLLPTNDHIFSLLVTYKLVKMEAYCIVILPQW